MNERRLHRSVDRDEAFQLLLEGQVTRAGRGTLALVDDRGRLIAGAGRPRAVWAIARMAADEPRPGEALAVESIVSSQESLRLAAVAVPSLAFDDAARGVARILASL